MRLNASDRCLLEIYYEETINETDTANSKKQLTVRKPAFFRYENSIKLIRIDKMRPAICPDNNQRFDVGRVVSLPVRFIEHRGRIFE